LLKSWAEYFKTFLGSILLRNFGVNSLTLFCKVDSFREMRKILFNNKMT
jgi:hypothetical protein